MHSTSTWDMPEGGPLTWDMVVRRAMSVLTLLGLITAAMVFEGRHWAGPRSAATVVLVLLAAAGVVATHIAGRQRPSLLPWVLVPTALLGLAAGVASPVGIAVVFLFFPLGMAAKSWPIPRALGVTVAASALYWGVNWLVNHDVASLWLIAALAGSFLSGMLDRAYQDRVRQTRELLAQTERARVAEARSAALAERTRIAREMHDVLAHSLAGLAVQLEAADALLGTDRVEQARDVVRRCRQLAREGLAETKQAVLALREGPPQPLPDALGGLLDTFGPQLRGQLQVDGTLRELDPEATFALYRIAQESMTNAVKHAPGSPVSVALDYAPTAVTLVVHNEPSDGPAPAGDPIGAGSGYGVTGMRERLEPLGGELTVGPAGAGWRVTAKIPV
ncbi:MAG: sensor histidine kinase [Actinocatenispora sp.]